MFDLSEKCSVVEIFYKSLFVAEKLGEYSMDNTFVISRLSELVYVKVNFARTSVDIFENEKIVFHAHDLIDGSVSGIVIDIGNWITLLDNYFIYYCDNTPAE